MAEPAQSLGFNVLLYLHEYWSHSAGPPIHLYSPADAEKFCSSDFYELEWEGLAAIGIFYLFVNFWI